jgi:hypothetical protein
MWVMMRLPAYVGNPTGWKPMPQTPTQSIVHDPNDFLIDRFDGARLLRITPWPVTEGHSDAWSLSLSDDKILAVSNTGPFAIVEKHLLIREWFGSCTSDD